LRGAQSLSISALMKTIFERRKDWFVERGTKVGYMLGVPCVHVIVVCSYCHLDLTTFVALVYTLHNIYKTFEVQFHPVRNQDYWCPYTSPNFILNPHMRRSKFRRPVIIRIHNQMDEPIQNRSRKYSYCCNESHNRKWYCYVTHFNNNIFHFFHFNIYIFYFFQFYILMCKFLYQIIHNLLNFLIFISKFSRQFFLFHKLFKHFFKYLKLMICARIRSINRRCIKERRNRFQ